MDRVREEQFVATFEFLHLGRFVALGQQRCTGAQHVEDDYVDDHANMAVSRAVGIGFFPTLVERELDLEVVAGVAQLAPTKYGRKRSRRDGYGRMAPQRL